MRKKMKETGGGGDDKREMVAGNCVCVLGSNGGEMYMGKGRKCEECSVDEIEQEEVGRIVLRG